MRTKGVDDFWLIRSVVRYMIAKERHVVLAGRLISKHSIYSHMRYWRRYSKRETREVFRQIALTCPGVRFSNRGIFFPRDYAEERQTFRWPRHPSDQVAPTSSS